MFFPDEPDSTAQSQKWLKVGKEGLMLVGFSILPLGIGDSLGDRIAEVLKIIDESGLPYKVNPMGTVVEGEWDELFRLIRRCHETALKGSGRVVTQISIDDRKGRRKRIELKVKSLEKRMGKTLRK